MDWRGRASLALGGVAVAALALLVIITVAARPSTEDTVDGYPSEAAYGRALFAAKGCTRCHTHAAVPNPDFSTNLGPNLSHYHNDPAFLRRWLRDPAAVKPGTLMPNLQLSDSEIDALIAFLNSSPAP